MRNSFPIVEECIVICLCLLINALLAAYEMAFVSVPRLELRNLARSGDKRAQILYSLGESPERTLSIIQIGITLVGAISAAVGGIGATESLRPYLANRMGLQEGYAEIMAILLVVLPLTYLNVVIGELVPKTLALRNPRKIALAGARWLFWADRVLAPIVLVLEWSTRRIVSLFSRRDQTLEVRHHPPAGPAEIFSFSPVHQRLLFNMLALEKKKIKHIFLPWNQVASVAEGDRIEKVTEVVVRSGHTRLPVTAGESVVGILHTKEFIALREAGEVNWRSIVRPHLTVQPTDSALGVLRLMQEKRCQMALVFSPDRGRLGIVTIADILAEIVGDIFDEDDDGAVRQILAAKAKARFEDWKSPIG